MSNALGMYRTVKRLGIPDSNIILMLADDASCNARNKFPGAVFANSKKELDLYGENIEVDYRGYEVTVENFIRVLTGRHDPSVPRSKRLLTDSNSNIFVYMTGHGGVEFLKFQDNEEISAHDLADAVEQMWQKKRRVLAPLALLSICVVPTDLENRYNEIFFMSDTCQATTLQTKFYSPNILAIGSAQMGENSYSHSNDEEIGVAIIDGFTHFLLQYMEGINKTSHVTMEDLFNSFDPVKIKSHPGVRSDLFNRPLSQTLLTDFFGGVSQIEVVDDDASSASPSSSEDDEQYEALLQDLTTLPTSKQGDCDEPCSEETTYHSPPLGYDEEAIEKLDALRAAHEQKVKEREEEARKEAKWDETKRGLRLWGGVGVVGMLVGFVMWR
ncbi:glycosylphosphatidylinositol anchor biosynthesis protein [Coprinopsis sp. MPI-PUGE-AT-0042]|nr:glycosylphosphatidylinositol anchor biosynthesis protein [Coprinopsis sp. MPI-PUGE-AT-0042]